MREKDAPPALAALQEWLGPVVFKRWTRIVAFISAKYPGVFQQNDWVYGGRQHGWGLRFKKSKALCTLIPEKNHAVAVIVLGHQERDKVMAIMPDLTRGVREIIEKTPTLHDGKWLAIPLKSDTLNDIERLLTLKKPPVPEGSACNKIPRPRY